MQPSRFDGISMIAAATVFLGVFAIGLAQLYCAHPAEDAFILFKYAENVARGQGIVYYAGGPRTEGATDLLWLMLLAGSVAAGMSVAVAALVWNALGAALCAVLLDREIAQSGLSRRGRLLFLTVPLSLPFVAGAPAAYLGFSSLLYQALVLATFVLTADDRRRFVSAVPWMGLALALFRPDGAFFAAGFVIAAAAAVFRTARWRPFALSTGGAAAVGAAYFVGRWAYFGEPLPLPLYVKSYGVLHGALADLVRHHLPWLKGIGFQFMWLKSLLGPAFLATALAVVVLLPPAPGPAARACLRRSFVAGFASILFLAALSVAFQAQNVHFRYQAPVTLLLLFALGGIAARRIAEAPAPLGRALLFAAVLGALIPSVVGGAGVILADLRGRSYIDVLPARLATVLHPGRTIALTDAGRLAYWTNSRIIDVPGLNYPPTARRPVSTEQLAAIDPDVLLIHPGASVVGESFEPDEDSPASWQVGADRLERQISPEYRSVFAHGLDDYRATSNTATVAAAVMLRYLVERRNEYAVESVFYQGGYRHLLAYRRDLPEAEAIGAALAESVTGRGYASFAALKGFPRARPFDTEIDDNPRTPAPPGPVERPSRSHAN
jgi:arabinofuranosyltransferase